MTHLQLIVPVLFVAHLSSAAQNIFYVKTDYSPPEACPDEPCLTLDQYTEQADVYFTSGATFAFMAGNHTPELTVNLNDIFNVTFNGSNDTDTVIFNITMSYKNVTNVNVYKLTFVLYFDYEDPAAFIVVDSKDIFIIFSTFRGSENQTSRAVQSLNSNIEIVNCSFQMNMEDNGGAIYAYESQIFLKGNTFTKNKAHYFGGAIFGNKSLLVLEESLGNTFEHNSAQSHGGAIALFNSTIKSTSESSLESCPTYFSHNRAVFGGAIYLTDSNASISGNAFTLNFTYNTAAYSGGAIALFGHSSHMTIALAPKHLNFIGNEAGPLPSKRQRKQEAAGGAIVLFGDVFISLGNEQGTSLFLNNSATYHTSEIIPGSHYLLSLGGAVFFEYGSCVLLGRHNYTHNQAYSGGAIALKNMMAVFNGTAISVTHNTASVDAGGGMWSRNSRIFFTQSESFTFANNSAQTQGGGIWALSNFEFVVSSVYFVNNVIVNSLGCGGAVYITLTPENGSILDNITVIGNTANALCIFQSNVTISGNTTFSNNTGGSAVSANVASIVFNTSTRFADNEGWYGGAINSLYSQIIFHNHTTFMNNNAKYKGGAIFSVGTEFTLKSIAKFVHNSAPIGGAMYFEGASQLILGPNSQLLTFFNNASQKGGAIFNNDDATHVQCSSDLSTEFKTSQDIISNKFPPCLIHLKGLTVDNINKSRMIMRSFHDSAKNGSYMFGGLLDKCHTAVLDELGIDKWLVLYEVLQKNILRITKNNTATKNTIISAPYMLCSCESDTVYNCSTVIHINTVYRGQTFNVSLLALAQGSIPVATRITAVTAARLKPNQPSQALPQHCANISYNVFSKNVSAKLRLYPDGPCRDTGFAVVTVDMTILPCPLGFNQSADQCVCDSRLPGDNVECIIEDRAYISKKSGSKLWIGVQKNQSNPGLILSKTCPMDYCRNDINLTLSDLDVQCNHNRSGKLCGACAANHSLVLGSSKCQVCSNIYLLLILLFLAAGLALVVFLTFLRLTVATGMINSLILYANMVHVNKTVFFPDNQRNILTVAIAWMNLDFGFQTCFYDGMDAYAQTWLQFAFPLYVWILISLIILTSRHSITVSKLIGSNPVAVLATLLLMSYTKLLRIIIEVYSSVELDYPNKTERVWLKDANVPYLESRHLILTVMTSLLVFFLFLPYTLLLLVGHKLYRFTGKKCCFWLPKVRPLLESYYAPFRISTRYWTGFLLLVRCGLYVIFSSYSLGATSKSLFAMNMTFTALSMYLLWVRIYANYYTNIMEAFVYLNLILLSTATLADANIPALVYSLVGLAFATKIAVITHCFHSTYIAKSAIWFRFKTKMEAIIEAARAKIQKDGDCEPLLASQRRPHDYASRDPQNSKIVTRTIVALREPLLDDVPDDKEE